MPVGKSTMISSIRNSSLCCEVALAGLSCFPEESFVVFSIDSGEGKLHSRNLIVQRRHVGFVSSHCHEFTQINEGGYFDPSTPTCKTSYSQCSLTCKPISHAPVRIL